MFEASRRSRSPRLPLLLALICGCGGGPGKAPTGGSGGEGEGGTGGGSGSGGSSPRDSGSVPTPTAGTDGSSAPPADAAPDAAADAGVPADTATPPPAGNPYVYVGATSDPRLRIFQLDLATGALTPKGMAMANEAPNYLAVHPTRRFLYVTSQVAAGRVVAFAVDPTGMLTRLNDMATGGAEPAHISLHRSGKWLFVANYTGGNASVLPVGDDGRLGAAVSTVPAGAEAHMIVEDGASGNFVFVPSKGSNRIGQFRFDQVSGKLTPNEPPSVAEGGAPRHIAFHRSGRFAYLLTEGTRTVVAYKYDSTAGLLTAFDRVVAGDSGFASHIAMHPSKDLFYAAVRGPDTITTFSIDPEGRPKVVGRATAELSYPWDFSVDATGSYLVAANNTSSSIKVFRVDQQTGTLTLVGGAAVPAQVRAVRVVFPPAP
jgi:6-phosphogluconolactonase